MTPTRAVRLSSFSRSAWCTLVRVVVAAPSAMRARLLGVTRLDDFGERGVLSGLAADPALARALAADLHRTVHDPGAWDRAVEIERARQMWSLARNPKES